jgi:hypothetical protein
MSSHGRGSSDENGILQLQLLLLSSAFVLLLSFQTYSLIRDRVALFSVRAGQEANVQQSLKLRQQLDSLAKGTARLADDGDANARAVVDAMRKQGVTLKAPPGQP